MQLVKRVKKFGQGSPPLPNICLQEVLPNTHCVWYQMYILMIITFLNWCPTLITTPPWTEEKKSEAKYQVMATDKSKVRLLQLLLVCMKTSVSVVGGVVGSGGGGGSVPVTV